MASSRKSRANCSFKLNNPDVTPKKFAPSASADVDAAARNTLRGDVFRSESVVVDDVDDDDDVVDDVVLLSSSSSREARIVVVVVVVIAAPLCFPPLPFESRKQRESDVVGIVVRALSCIVLIGKKVWISILHFSIYKKALKRDALDETNAAVARRVVVVVQRELFLVVVFVDVSWERFPSAKTARAFGDVLSSSSSPGKQQQQRKKLRCSSRDDNDRFSVHGRPRVVVHVREQHFVRDELDRELGQTRDDCNRATFFGPHD